MPASVSPRVGIWRWMFMAVVFLLTLLQDLASASDLYSSLKLNKCYCDKYQAWDGAKCFNSSTSLPIYQFDFDVTEKHEIDVAKNAKAHPTSRFENVVVRDIQCPADHRPRILENTEILLLPDGRLLWLKTATTLPSESFCAIHLWLNGYTLFDAKVCLPPPAVPRCCPVDHLLRRNGACYPDGTLKPPPILLGSHEEEWDRLDGDMSPLTCEDHEHFHYVPLRTQLGNLGLLEESYPVAKLGWIPPVWTASRPWNTKYCVGLYEGEGGLEYIAQICVKDYARYHEKQCGAAACVRKCCPEDKLLHNGMCVEAAYDYEKWLPSRLPNQTINEEWKIVTGEPGCIAIPYHEDMHLLPNGFLNVDEDIPAVPPSDYCLDYLLDNTANISNLAIVCSQQGNKECLWRDILIKVLLGVSCVFLVLTLVVYLGVAELRNQMYGRCLISMVVAMLTAYLCVMVQPPEDHSNARCHAQAFITQLSSLAVFFWLNVMCFDMWKILRGTVRQHYSLKVFLWYSAYAWGCPLMISIITIALDVAHPAGDLIYPDFYDGFCWFNENAAYWLYFSGFILLLVLINVGFFIHVAITLYQKMKQRSQNFETPNNHLTKAAKPKQRVWLFVKLFLVMGVVWITDVLSVIGHRRTCNYWVLTDVINSLQGVFIFIVAVCNKDNLKKVKDTWGARFSVLRKTIPNLSSRRPTQTNTLSIDDTDVSRKTSITSLPRKISQASTIFFSSSKKSATLNPPPNSTNHQGERKGSNVSIKDIIPMASMQE